MKTAMIKPNYHLAVLFIAVMAFLLCAWPISGKTALGSSNVSEIGVLENTVSKSLTALGKSIIYRSKALGDSNETEVGIEVASVGLIRLFRNADEVVDIVDDINIGGGRPVTQEVLEQNNQGREVTQGGGNSLEIAENVDANIQQTQVGNASSNFSGSAAAGNVPEGIPNRGLGETGGRGQAEEVLEGGNGQAISGHGTFTPGSGSVTIPNGTTLIAPRDGIRIHDSSGQVLETVDLDVFAVSNPQQRIDLVNQQLDSLGVTNSRIRDRVLDDLDDIQIVRSGDNTYNYTVTEPTNLRVFENSTTVDRPTLLDEILDEDLGCVALATCTK